MDPEKRSNEVRLVSADSHVVEDPALWADILPMSFWPDATKYFSIKGGKDPAYRLEEMAEDGVLAEVLYPSLAMNIFALGPDEVQTQQDAFTTYNDWLVDYCGTAPEQLVGIACLSTYDIAAAIAELERGKQNGLRGGMIWQIPHQSIPFHSRHYDPLWEASAELGMPLSMHILTGPEWKTANIVAEQSEIEFYRRLTNLKLLGALDALFELIFGGALERHPTAKLVLVENEIGWIPFMLQLWDRYYGRRGTGAFVELSIEHSPTEIFERQVYATFFEDAIGAYLLGTWGTTRCMWSSDFPHPNSTWPNSVNVVNTQLSHLDPDAFNRVLHGTVCELYGMSIDASAAAGASRS